MGNPEIPTRATTETHESSFGALASVTLAALRLLIAGERVQVLRELDDFLLRDIGASGDDIWRVHRLRNGDRPTLSVG